eukprot:sb/3474850/
MTSHAHIWNKVVTPKSWGSGTILHTTEAASTYSECYEAYEMSDATCTEFKTGYEAGYNAEVGVSYTDFDIECGSVDACTKDCLISGAGRNVIPATFVLIAALIARLLAGQSWEADMREMQWGRDGMKRMGRS